MATAEQSLTRNLTRSSDPAPRAETLDTAARVLRLVAVFRLIAALALLLAGLIYDDPRFVGARYPELFTGCAIIYSLVAGIILATHLRTNSTMRDIVPMQVIADVVGVTFLMHASGGISSGIGALLVVYVGAASLALRGRYAFSAAAVSALAVLAEQGLSYTAGVTGANAFMPAGFLGAIIFTIALAAHPLARRLQESEALARQRGIDLANMAQLNEYIIQNLRESIVVVDEQDRIRLINQSAAEHLGAESRRPGQALRDISPSLGRALGAWRRSGTGFGTIAGFMSADGSTNINSYMAPLEGRPEGPVLIFLEDASLLSQKAQQTKLAALGRLSASIAHEIRNPVGALSHAGQLLQESASVGNDEQRLLDIISKNSQRVSEIVENVLQLSRREETRPEMISLRSWLGEFAAEFSSTLELPAGRLSVANSAELNVRMDPGHLRQICWNLCENAVRYGEKVTVRYGRLTGNRRPYLDVTDTGPGIPPEMEDQLFEPFATGRAGGTGLGLFISRELCECNGAALIYEKPDGGGCIFRVVFADPDRWVTGG